MTVNCTETTGNRIYKSSVFIMLFEEKEKLLELYNAVSGKHYENPEDLVNLLDLANKGESPRITKALLDSYIDDPDTDVDQLFEDTLDFLGKANATKKIVGMIRQRIEEAKAKQDQN